MPKFTMPKSADFNKYFLAKKALYEPKKEPVWVYLEKEMQANLDKKPYNKKVGDWLEFLKDLKHHYYLESKRQQQILIKEGGPLWYLEMSGWQKDVLKNLMQDIHYDLLEDVPIRTRKSLSDLGITRSIPTGVLMKAMVGAGGDSAVFIWKLYTAIYKRPPSDLRGEYDMDAMILMSALVFIDMDECVQSLKELTKPAKETPKPAKKKYVKKYYEPKCRYGMYLQKNYIHDCCTHPSPQRGRTVARPPPRMEKKIRIRSDNSYERLRKDHAFIEKRLQRSKRAKQAERICNYKFWEPPVYLRATDPHMAEYCKKLKLLQKKPPVKHRSEFENQQFNVGPVCFVGGRPRYLLNNVITLPTGYIPIHGGTTLFKTGEYLTIISGAIKFPLDKNEQCDKTCDCLTKWGTAVMQYLEESKCTCGHYYDFYQEGKSREKYFYPPTKHVPMWFDEAKVFQQDPIEDFIKEAVRLAEMSQDPSPVPSHQELSAGGIKTKDLLESFLADLSDTALVIPHLPQACLLNNLREWVRNRIKGKLPPDAHRQSVIQSMRRWLWLKHMDFRKRAYKIRFSKEELEKMTWKYRGNLQSLFEFLLRDFTTRNRRSQLEQTRLWWSTMKYDRYPSEAFLDVYFSYMPGRMKDIHILTPFNSELTPRNIFKTCPINR